MVGTDIGADESALCVVNAGTPRYALLRELCSKLCPKENLPHSQFSEEMTPNFAKRPLAASILTLRKLAVLGEELATYHGSPSEARRESGGR